MTADNQDSHGSADQLLAQAEELIWSLLDDNLPEDGVLHLEGMIKQHDNVRDLYLDCVQLHADLAGHFAQVPKLNIPELSDSPDSPDSPVLGSLSNATPGIDAGPPVTD